MNKSEFCKVFWKLGNPLSIHYRGMCPSRTLIWELERYILLLLLYSLLNSLDNSRHVVLMTRPAWRWLTATRRLINDTNGVTNIHSTDRWSRERVKLASQQSGQLPLWWQTHLIYTFMMNSLIAMLMGPTLDPSGADSTQVGPMLAPWPLLYRSASSVILPRYSIIFREKLYWSYDLLSADVFCSIKIYLVRYFVQYSLPKSTSFSMSDLWTCMRYLFQIGIRSCAAWSHSLLWAGPRQCVMPISYNTPAILYRVRLIRI